MRLVKFSLKNTERVLLGVEETQGGYIAPISNSLQELMNGGDSLLDSIREKMRTEKLKGSLATVERNQVDLLAPVDKPSKILGIGLNYKDGAKEMGKEIPAAPIVFLKHTDTISGPEDNIALPLESKQVDWEVELAIVIGKQGRYIKKEEALDYVFGYTVAVDYTARDLIPQNSGLWTLAKNFPGFCALGPALVTSDMINYKDLRLTTKVNGKMKQDSNTANMIFDVRELIEYVSKFSVLYPGDIILTGTPAGVGVARNPQEFVQRGDVVECEVQKIGAIKNKMTFYVAH